MKILIDESLDIKIKSYISDFDAYTVKDMGWLGIRNGELLALAERNEFNLFLTADRNIRHQQNLKKFNLIVVAFKSFTNDITSHINLIPQLKNQLKKIDEEKITTGYYEI